ncbi:hypothetical protein RUM43_011812 [Polyplax serrata]|uniref:Uncharacterized protein n=1 Tax=Polyplax serrata TaxID=468196 RepID=A0AAN8S7E5_POLSC
MPFWDCYQTYEHTPFWNSALCTFRPVETEQLVVGWYRCQTIARAGVGKRSSLDFNCTTLNATDHPHQYGCLSHLGLGCRNNPGRIPYWFDGNCCEAAKTAPLSSCTYFSSRDEKKRSISGVG